MIRIFSRLPVPEFGRWRLESSPTQRHWRNVTTDGHGARSLTLILSGYKPYLPTTEGVTLSAFYVASNALNARYGKQALSLPLKSLIAGYGIGTYTRCGLTATSDFGTRFACEVIASDDEPDESYEWDEYRPINALCGSCGACVRACPVNAMDMNGRVDVEKCLRAQAQYNDVPFPDESRELIGASIWGCDICMDACPLNGGAVLERMPDELESALNLRRLLTGDVKPLGEWIGTNYARKARMASRAAMVAANLKKKEFVPEIKELLSSDQDFVRAAARWALEKLNAE